MSRIYVASSWRNEDQPNVVKALRAAGHEVYDFRHPNVQGPPDAPESGFGWRECHPNPPPWSAEDTRNVLQHPRAQEGFRADHAAMEWADTFVMVQPCGRSAHLELGWACGKGKRTIVLLADGHEPELMLLEAAHLCVSLAEVVDLLKPRKPPISDKRCFIGADEAVAALDVRNDRVHCFTGGGGAMIGADWDLAEVDALFRRNKPELSGSFARSMGHGIGVIDRGRLLVFATVEARVVEIEARHAGDQP